MDDRRDGRAADGTATRAALEQTVRDTIGVVLGRNIPAGDPLVRDDQPDWDSLKHIELVFALEGALGIRFEAEEIGELTDVDAIVELAEKHGAA